MNNRFRKLVQNQEGITALETAIILIAFVVVASVFAFTILSAGTFTTERGKEAIYAGLSEVRGTMQMKGSVIAKGEAGVAVSTVQFTIATVAGGEPIDLSIGANQKLVVDYRDSENVATNVPISMSQIVGDDNSMLEDGELWQILVPLNGVVVAGNYSAGSASAALVGDLTDYNLGANELFSLEIKPPNGAVILLERTLPAYIDDVMDLH